MVKRILKGQAGIAFIVEIILVAVVLGVIATAGFGYYKAKQAGTPQPATPKPSTSPKAVASPSPRPDSYAGWATFVGTCSGFNFQHPADWSLKLNDSFIDNNCQIATVTTPGGNALMWVPAYYGDGPGCDWSAANGGKNECPIVTTLKSEELDLKGELADVYMVEQVLCNESKQCEGRVALVGKPTDTVPRWTVGTSQRYPLVVFAPHAMFMTQGKQTSIGNPTIPILKFDEASAKAWLKSDDVQKAELAMKSLIKRSP